jgi:hypothetical protein
MTSGFLCRERKNRKVSTIHDVFPIPDYSKIEPNDEITESIRAYLHRLA